MLDKYFQYAKIYTLINKFIHGLFNKKMLHYETSDNDKKCIFDLKNPAAASEEPNKPVAQEPAKTKTPHLRGF
jgi:hypothetical protein